MNETNQNRQVRVIPATKRWVSDRRQLMTLDNVRVAAYCRVSTGDESQQTSYTKQVEYYTRIIHTNPRWQFAGIYADEAATGTSRKKRVQFNRMISDAMEGEIDYIITKSISRFARNTLDALDCVRQMQQLDPPVGVYFEKENIDTLDVKSELILTILSARPKTRAVPYLIIYAGRFSGIFRRASLISILTDFLDITKDQRESG